MGISDITSPPLLHHGRSTVFLTVVVKASHSLKGAIVKNFHRCLSGKNKLGAHEVLESR